MGGDVGDVHPDAYRSVRQSFSRDGVVEVARRGWVHREGRQLAQVASYALLQLDLRLGPSARACLARFALDRRVKAERVPGLAHHLLYGVTSGFSALLRRPHDAGVRRSAQSRCYALASRTAARRLCARALLVRDLPLRGTCTRCLGALARTAFLTALARPVGLTSLARPSARAAARRAHLTLASSVCSATSRAWSLSTWLCTRTSGVMPAPSLTPPPPRLRPLGVKYSPTVILIAPPPESGSSSWKTPLP